MAKSARIISAFCCILTNLHFLIPWIAPHLENQGSFMNANRNRQGWCKGFDFSEVENVLGNSFFILFFFFLWLGFHRKEDGKFQNIWNCRMSVTRCSVSARPRTSAFVRDLTSYGFPAPGSAFSLCFQLGLLLLYPLEKRNFKPAQFAQDIFRCGSWDCNPRISFPLGKERSRTFQFLFLSI